MNSLSMGQNQLVSSLMRPSRAFRDKSVRCLFQQLVAGNRYSLVSVGKAPLEMLLKSWLTSSVEAWESFSSRDDMGCTEHSSRSSKKN